MKKILRILKWLGIVFAVLLVLAAGALYVLSRDIAPTDVSDLMPPERPVVAPEDNAFTYFEKADEMLSRPFETMILRDFLQDKSVDTNELRKVLLKYDELVYVLEEGTKRDICIVPEVNQFKCIDPYIRTWVNTSQILWAKARYERISGDLPSATAACIILLKYGDLLQRHADTAVYYLVAGSVCGKGLTEVRLIAHDKGVTADILVDLLSAVNDLASVDENFIQMLKKEYRFNVGYWSADIFDEISSSCEIVNRIASGVTLQPNKVKSFFAIYTGDMISNANKTYDRLNLLDSDEILAVAKEQGVTPLAFSFYAEDILGCFLKLRASLFERKAKKESIVSATCLLLALNLYDKRNGELPDNLSQLVPEYIASVPRDPYDGNPFRYDRNKQIVYSIGRNFKDEGGSIERAYRGRKLQAGARFKAEDYIWGIKKDQFPRRKETPIYR